MKTIHLVDTFNLLFKFYYPFRDLHTSEGFNTAWLSAFAHVVQKVYKFKSDCVIFALESPQSQRKILYPDYKAKRQAPPHLDEQLPIVLEWIKKMGLCAVSIEGYESDDVIASLCTLFAHQYKIRILSNDKDFYQLVDDNICLHDFASNTNRGPEFCLAKYKIHPRQFRDYQGLVGDSSDGYRGVEGIGPTYAAKLLRAFDHLENLYQCVQTPEIKAILPPKLLQALIRDKDQAFLSRQLATLETRLFHKRGFDLASAYFPQENPLLRIHPELREYEMFALLKQITPKTLFENPAFVDIPIYTPTEATEWIAHFPVCAVQLVATQKEVIGLGVLGLEALEKHASAPFVFVDMRHLGDYACLQTLYGRKLLGYQIKDIFNAFRHHNIPLPADYEDTALLAWLARSNLEPNIGALGRLFKQSAHQLDAIKEHHLSLPKLAYLASENARLIAQACIHYQQTLSPALLGVARQLEYPLLKTLFEMEGHGFSIDIGYFKRLHGQFKSTLKDLENSVQRVVGPININSSKQWAQLLYQHLGLQTKGIKKIKTGFSTDEASLKILQETYKDEMIQGINVGALLDLLLKHREVFKLQSTYVEPFLTRHMGGKIHTIFYQNTTASSRLSSAHPNLQNIPMRNILGKKIAQGFVASPGFLLLGIDYSQIELRLLAHFSQDPSLVEAFRQHQDIHLNTARVLFGCQALEKRPVAKSINFGLLYGMGARRLSEALKISLEQAKEYMERYFNRFPTIKHFLEELKARIATEGKITTLLGHERHFDFAHASPKLRADYLREGANTLFQGSASDLVKLAMLQIQERYAKRPEIKMLVQVHDEIVLEAPQTDASLIASEIKELMETIYPLRVPLECHANIASNWGDLKS